MTQHPELLPTHVARASKPGALMGSLRGFCCAVLGSFCVLLVVPSNAWARVFSCVAPCNPKKRGAHKGGEGGLGLRGSLAQRRRGLETLPAFPARRARTCTSRRSQQGMTRHDLA